MRHAINGPSLVKQFILSRSPDLVPDDWTAHDQMGWHVATHSTDGLPIIEAVAACGSRVGWLIGFGVDLEAGLLTESLRVPAEVGDRDFVPAFEQRIYDLGGRFLVVLLTEGTSRVYLDSCGSLAAVYASRFEAVCSTTTLLPGEEDSEDRDLVATLDIPRCDNWYPFGLTPRIDALRLLPNHYLDLESWQPVRHWPSLQLAPVDSGKSAQRLIDAIADTAETLVRRLSEAAPLTASLTAGHDSRMLLACSRPLRDRMDFFTEAHRDRTGRIDRQIAGRIAGRFGLSHSIVRWEPASEEELETWLYRTGRCVAGRTWMAARTATRSGRDGFKLLGTASETARSSYWKLADIGREKPAVAEVVAALRLPPAPQVLEGARNWLEAVPVSDFPMAMDLLQLEQRVGCWAAPQSYGHVSSKSDIMGWNHQRVIEGFLRLPLEVRAAKDVSAAIIGSRWPELLEWPFNDFVGPPAVADRAIRRVRRFFREHPRAGRILRLGR